TFTRRRDSSLTISTDSRARSVPVAGTAISTARGSSTTTSTDRAGGAARLPGATASARGAAPAAGARPRDAAKAARSTPAKASEAIKGTLRMGPRDWDRHPPAQAAQTENSHEERSAREPTPSQFHVE